MIDGQKFFINQLNIIFKKLQQIKEIITQLVVYWTIIISKTITR